MHLLPCTGYYYITLADLINKKEYMARMHMAAARKYAGDKKELLSRLAQEEKSYADALKKEYSVLFSSLSKTDSHIVDKNISISDLIRCETSSTLHFSHMARSAPTKKIADILKDIAQKDAQHGYLLLLIL